MTGLGTQRSQRRQHLINSSIAELRHSYFIISKHYLLITSKRLTELEHLQFRTDTDCQLQTSSDKQHHHDEIYSLGKPTIISQWYILMSQPYFTCCYQATTHVTGNDWFSSTMRKNLPKITSVFSSFSSSVCLWMRSQNTVCIITETSVSAQSLDELIQRVGWEFVLIFTPPGKQYFSVRWAGSNNTA